MLTVIEAQLGALTKQVQGACTCQKKNMMQAKIIALAMKVKVHPNHILIVEKFL
jgi:hypothetical protein